MKNHNGVLSLPTPAEIRINRDLMEMKTHKLRTHLFESQLSNIIKNPLNGTYSMYVSFENKDSRLQCDFCLIFNNGYPYNAPVVQYVDNGQILNLNILSPKKWSPVLSINSVLFAIELNLLDPEIEENINVKDLFEKQNSFFTDSKMISDEYTFTNSPKIKNKTQNSPIKSTFVYERKKRLIKELENINSIYTQRDFFLFKKFKYSSNDVYIKSNYN